MVEYHSLINPFMNKMAAMVSVTANSTTPMRRKAHPPRAFGRAGFILAQRPVAEAVGIKPPNAEQNRRRDVKPGMVKSGYLAFTA
jgi:hypothetical protein